MEVARENISQYIFIEIKVSKERRKRALEYLYLVYLNSPALICGNEVWTNRGNQVNGRRYDRKGLGILYDNDFD